MGPSEDEIVARLADLRRRREAVDREIADLMLYLELGRRLGGGGGAAPGAPADTVRGPVPPASASETPPAPDQASPAAPSPMDRASSDRASRDPDLRDHPRSPAASGSPAAPGPAGPSSTAREIPPAVAFADDPAGARRYGRALVEAACAVLARAGRPLHAGEILEALVARGFAVPGRDPVAALNTRLWKRAGPEGPLRRAGEAVYALAGDALSGDTLARDVSAGDADRR